MTRRSWLDVRWLLVCLAVVATVCWIFDDETALAVHTIGGGLLVNSDALLPAAFGWDIAHHAYAWHGFQLPRVPSLVPDLLVSVGVQLLTGSWRVAYLTYAVLLFGLLTSSAGLVINSALRCGASVGALCFLAVAMPVLLGGLGSPTLSLWHLELFALVSHGGQFCLSVLALYLVWRLCARRGTLDFALVFVLGAVVVQSDRLAVATFIAPAAIGVAYACWRGSLEWRVAGLVLLTIVAAGAAGWLLPVGFEHQPNAAIDWKGIDGHLAGFASELRVLAREHPLAMLLIVAAPLLSGLVLGLTGRPSTGDGRDMRGLGVGFWWVVAVTAMAAGIAATAALYVDEPSFRYGGAAFWWPVILVGMALAHLFGRWAGGISTVAVGAMTALFALAFSWNGPHPPRVLSWRNPLSACLLRASPTHHLRAGLAAYWPARLIAAGTDWQLQVDQVTRDGRAFYWGNDPYWFIHDVHDGRAPPPYNFIVMHDLDEGAIRQRYGAPDQTLDCNGTPIWIYDDADRLSGVLAHDSPAVFAAFLPDGRPLCVPAESFYGRDARAEAGRLRVRPEGTGRQIATWGPYIDLPRGAWRVRLFYRLATPTAGSASWDIAGRPQGDLAAAALPDNGTMQTSEAVVRLDRPKGGAEIRTFLPPGSTLDLYGALITPLEADGARTVPCP